MSDTTGLDKPTDYFNTILWVGNGTAIGSGGKTVTGIGFQPDLVWGKARSGTDAVDNHQLINAVRGVTKSTRPNNSTTERTETEGLTSFTSDGFTLGSNGQLNRNGNNCVAWNWKCETGVSGTTTGSGSERSYSGRVNTTAGISIINYAGNSTSGHTIPHNLGATPKIIFLKNLGDTGDWIIHVGALNDPEKVLSLNLTDAGTNFNAGFNTTNPTSSVFTLGNSVAVNDDNQQYLAICFAEKKGYSKFGKYTGNGNADGSFIYCGFKPAWVMFKSSSFAGENWDIYDNKRESFNVMDTTLKADSNGAESSNSLFSVDFLSNGIKLRNGHTGTNQSGSTYIFMAFAENPFVTSTGIPTTAR